MFSVSSSKSISVIDANVNASPCIKYFGCYLDEHLIFKKFVSKKCEIISLNFYYIKHIRHYLTDDSCNQLEQSFITSHPDYSKSVIYGLPKCKIKSLQFLKNRAA